MTRGDRAYLAGLTLLTGCSWARWLATGSLKVDENYPSPVVSTLLFGVLVVGWALALYGFRCLLVEATAPQSTADRPIARVRRLAFVSLAVASLMLPMLSNDLFQLVSWASIAAHGQDVFTTASAVPTSEWSSFVSARWVQTLCHYGPVSLVTAMPAAIAHGNPWTAIAVLRACWLVPLVATMLASFRLLPSRSAFHTMLWLNPLWLLEGPGQLHCDLIGVTLVAAGVVLTLRRQVVGAALLYALAVVSKYTYVFVGPWFLLFDRISAKRRVLRAVVLAVAVGAVGVAFYAPFWLGPKTLAAPIADILKERPGGTIIEVVEDIALEIQGTLPSPATTPNAAAAEHDRVSMGGASTLVDAVSLFLRALTAAVGLRLVTMMLRKNRPDVTAIGTGALVIATVTLAAPKFEPWYLLPALPFFGLASTPEWRRWLTVAAGLSVLPTFANVLSSTSPIVPVWGVLSTGANVAWFLVMFRARFWDLFAAVVDVPSTPAPDAAGT